MKTSSCFLFICFLFNSAIAQHEHHVPKEGQKATHADKMKGDSLATHETHPSEVPMSHAYSLNLPMNRNGSGTGWLPDGSPMYGYMKHTSDWMFMMHGSLFLRYNNQDFTNKGIRGDKDFDRSEEHTSELQSPCNLVCRLLL